MNQETGHGEFTMMMKALKSISVIIAFFRLPHSYRVKEKNVILKSIAAATLLSILMVICEVIWLQGLERQTNNVPPIQTRFHNGN